MAYLRTRVLASFGMLSAGALVLVACSGKTLSLGTNTTQAQEVAPSLVSGTVSACSGGSAHPNVCCTAGPNQAGTCVVYPEAPFTQCDSGATTYPDPRQCCPLDGSGACAAPPPPGTSGGGGSSSGGACVYACPPGMYAPPGTSGDTCCTTDSSGATACTASGGVNGSGTSGNSGGSSSGSATSSSSSSGGNANGGAPSGCSGVCDCPACDPEAGACPPCNCDPTPCPTTPSCGACPPGWQTPQGSQPDLCCATDASGVIECFSQAEPPGQTTPSLDGGSGPPTSAACFGGGSADGAPAGCGCQTDANGHTYAVNCDPGTNLCTCTVDNGAPTASFPDDGNTCGDSTALFTSCGFPVN